MEKEMEELSSSSSSSSGGGCVIHVLVIDDSPLDRKIVEKLLKSAMFRVTTVESGKRAMELLGLDQEKIGSPLNDLKIDLILTDYCMPGMDGYDVLKLIKEHSCLKSLPVVIMSSEHDPQRISRCLSTGAEEFINKPLKPKHVQRLRSYVRPSTPTAKTGSKRKIQLDLIAETKGSERRPCIAGVAVA